MSDRSNALTVGRLAPGLRGWRPGRLRGSRAPALRSARAKAVMLDTPGMLVGMAKRSARLSSASTNLEDCGFRLSRSGDRSVRGAEHSDASTARASEAFPRFLAAVRSFTRASRANVKLASVRTRARFGLGAPPIPAMAQPMCEPGSPHPGDRSSPACRSPQRKRRA